MNHSKFKVFALCISLIALSACGPSKEEKANQVPALVIGNPLDYGVQDILLFPVGVNYYQPQINEKPNDEIRFDMDEGSTGNTSNGIAFSTRTKGLFDNNATMEYYNASEEDSDIRNILFYNLERKTTKPLLTDSLHILSFAIHREFERPCIFYRMVREDFNEDKKFNSSDPVMLYISNINGDSLIQITPDGQLFSEYFYYSKQQMLLVKTIVDMDQDKVFTKIDETNIIEVDLRDPKVGKEIFDPALKDQLRLLVK